MSLTPPKFPSLSPSSSSVWNESQPLLPTVSPVSEVLNDSTVSSAEPPTQSTWEWLCSIGRSVWETILAFFQYWFGGGRRVQTPVDHLSLEITPTPRTKSEPNFPVDFSIDKTLLSRTKSESQLKVLSAASSEKKELPERKLDLINFRSKSEPIPIENPVAFNKVRDPSPRDPSPIEGRDPSPAEMELACDADLPIHPSPEAGVVNPLPGEGANLPVDFRLEPVDVSLDQAIPLFNKRDKERAQHLLEFYQEIKRDIHGRGIEFIILHTDDKWLESTHNYIQWLFPLPYPSRAEPDAPRLTQEFINKFKEDGNMQYLYGSALNRMLRFYGLQKWKNSSGDVFVIRSQVFWDNHKNWLTPGNHNFLRLSRILISMKYLEYEPTLREALYHTLIDIASGVVLEVHVIEKVDPDVIADDKVLRLVNTGKGEKVIPFQTLGYWHSACYAPLQKFPDPL